MSEIIDNAIKEIKELRVIKENNISDDCAFGIACYKYFYNDGIYENSDFDDISICDWNQSFIVPISYLFPLKVQE